MAWPVAHTGIHTHTELVRRAKKCIRQFELKIADETEDPVEQLERNDIIRGAFEIAAWELTTTKGIFLNTSYRSGAPESFRTGTAALAKRMTDRVKNKLNGKGTNQILHDEVEHYQKLVKKRTADGSNWSKAAAESLQKIAAKRQKTNGDDDARAAGRSTGTQQQNTEQNPRTRHCRHAKHLRCRHCLEEMGGTSRITGT